MNYTWTIMSVDKDRFYLFNLIFITSFCFITLARVSVTLLMMKTVCPCLVSYLGGKVFIQIFAIWSDVAPGFYMRRGLSHDGAAKDTHKRTSSLLQKVARMMRYVCAN